MIFMFLFFFSFGTLNFLGWSVEISDLDSPQNPESYKFSSLPGNSWKPRQGAKETAQTDFYFLFIFASN